MDPHQRLALEIRSVRVTFRAALRHREVRGGAQLLDAQRRALHMLDAIAIRIDPERDEDLARLLEEARTEVRNGPQPAS
jgi:hypothetical protein